MQAQQQAQEMQQQQMQIEMAATEQKLQNKGIVKVLPDATACF